MALLFFVVPLLKLAVSTWTHEPAGRAVILSLLAIFYHNFLPLIRQITLLPLVRSISLARTNPLSTSASGGERDLAGGVSTISYYSRTRSAGGLLGLARRCKSA